MTTSLTILTRVSGGTVQSSLLPASSELADNADGTLQVRRVFNIPSHARPLIVLRLWNQRRGLLDLTRTEFDFAELGTYVESETVSLVRLAPSPTREYIPLS